MNSKIFAAIFLILLSLGIAGNTLAVSWNMIDSGGTTAGGHPTSVVVADFNGDGIPDYAVADKAGSVVVVLGKPNNAFALKQYIPDGDTPIAITAADFNNDGIIDLVVANWTGQQAKIYLGKGDGTFEAPTVITGLGLNPVHVRAAKLTSSGNYDLVFADFGGGTVTVALGNGDGTFQPPVPYSVGTNPRHVCIAPFRGPGNPMDIVATLWGENRVAVMYNNGSGALFGNVSSTSTTFPTYPVGGNPIAVEAGDINGDGNLDLAVTDFLSDRITILDGDGMGHFSVPASPQAKSLGTLSGPEELVLEDLNRDGVTDIAVADGLGNAVTVFLGRGDGTFQSARSYEAGLYPAALGTADFHRSGLPDLMAAGYSNNTTTVVRGLTTSRGTWGYGSIPSMQLTAGTSPSALLADDFNYDGVMDIAVANKGSNNISVFLNRKFGNMSGFGNFSSAVTTPAPDAPPLFAALSTISAPSAMASAAFTNRKTTNNALANFRADLAVANSGNNTVAILIGNGGGTFLLPQSASSPQILRTGIGPSAVKAADFNKDGKVDVAVCDEGSSDVMVFLGNGDGTFGPGKTYPLPAGSAPVSMATGDFNGDGNLDIAVGNSNNTVSVLLGNGKGAFGKPITSQAHTVSLSSIAANDLNGDGHLDLAVSDAATDSVIYLLGNGTGHFGKGRVLDTDASPAAVLAQAVTNHGRIDIVTANSGSGDITLHTAQSAFGSFSTANNFPAGSAPAAIVAHDFNGDGTTDLAVADAGSGLVTVLFGKDIVTLTINTTVKPAGDGTVAVEKVATRPFFSQIAANQYEVEAGKEIELAATPSPGFKFSKWTGDITGTGNPVYPVITSAKTTLNVTADFAPVNKGLYVSMVNPSSGSTVSGTVTLQAVATTTVSTIASVTFNVDGGPALAGTFNPATGYWEYALDTSVLASGGHTISVTVTTADGRHTATNSVTVTV